MGHDYHGIQLRLKRKFMIMMCLKKLKESYRQTSIV